MTHLLDMPRSPPPKKKRDWVENSHFEPLKWRFGKIGFVFKGVMFRFHISFWGCRWNWPTDTDMFFLPKLQWSSRDRWWKARGVLSVWAFFWATDWLDLLGIWHHKDPVINKSDKSGFHEMLCMGFSSTWNLEHGHQGFPCHQKSPQRGQGKYGRKITKRNPTTFGILGVGAKSSKRWWKITFR